MNIFLLLFSDLNCVEKVCRDNPCGIGRRCVAVSDATYRCECSTLMTGTGVGDSQSHHYFNSVTGGISNCDYKEEQPICTSEMCKIGNCVNNGVYLYWMYCENNSVTRLLSKKLLAACLEKWM